MSKLMQDIERVLVPKDQLEATVKKLGAQISKDYADKCPLLIGVLKGCVVFFSDLIRQLDIECQLDFMAVSSYGAGKNTTGEVKVLKDVSTTIENKHIIIIEDIVDSGITLNYLVNLLKFRGASSVEICTLLNKPERRQRDVYPKYVGFEIPNEFVVGYGLDYDERYRNLPEICVMKS